MDTVGERIASALPDQTVDEIATALFRYGADAVAYPADHMIFQEGERGDFVYFVLEGAVEISSAFRHLTQIQRGEFFGEMAFIDGEQRSGTALCLTAVRVLRLDFARFEAMLSREPQVARRLLVKLSHIVRELNRVATTDALTGCVARGHLMQTLARELHRSRRSGAPLSLMFIDVDGFKPVNDLLGHDEGDRLLQWVAATLTAATRTTDCVGRYGGDEFCIVLPETPAAGCPPIIARVLRTSRMPMLASLNDAVRRQGGRSTVSFSIGAVDTTTATANDPEAMLKDADAALYDAKRSGKGRGIVMLPTGRFEVLAA